MPHFIDLGFLGAKRKKKQDGSYETNDDGSFVFDKDSGGRAKYFIKTNDDVEIIVRTKVDGKTIEAPIDFINVHNSVTRMEEHIARAAEKEDEKKVEKLESTKSRYEKGGNLNYIKHQLQVVIDD